MTIEYTTTVQPLWRDWQSVSLQERNGMYHAPTAPVDPPHNGGGRIREHCGPWSLHSVQMLPMLGEPKLLIVWMREVHEDGGLHDRYCVCPACERRRDQEQKR